MERSRQPIQHRRRGKRTDSSSSSSRYSPNPEFQSNNLPITAKPLSFNHKYNSEEGSNINRSSRWNLKDCDEEDFAPIVGTCPFMCPVEERAQRERLRDLAVFERLDGNPGKTSSGVAVKKFCRTISSKDVQASDVRPLLVLEDTLNYLFNLLNSREYPFEVVHDFIFDRTRSIRQDLSMQNIIGDKAVLMYERMVKFHVISHHKLQRHSSGSPDISPMHHLNMEQLTKALSSLYSLYEANRNSHSICENEAEFRSFYVLLHLGSENQPMGGSLSLWFRRVPSSIIKSKEMCFARRILRYYRLGNYKRFICTTEAEASYLQYCIIEPYVNEVRALALSCVNYGGYKLHPYPLTDLSKLLLMKVESDVESLCSDCGLQTSTDEVGKRFLPAKQTSFCNPKGGFKNFYQVDSERLERTWNRGGTIGNAKERGGLYFLEVSHPEGYAQTASSVVSHVSYSI